MGEARPLRGPGRREVGHGTLAEKAIANVLPAESEFPYTLRVVAETLESNGSSSMATVCGATLSLMDAGVPIKAPVAGIAMGLIEDGKRVAILSDILGDEDHLGDMDFKVAGTRKGVTAVQMDIKVRSVDWAVMERALEQARVGRLHILDCMESETRDVLGGKFEARAEVASHAPRMSQLRIKPDRIRDVIGPGGRVIRAIQEATGAKIDIEDNGEVKVFAPDRSQLERAQAMIEELTQEAEIGRVYLGKVKRIADFGAFVEIFPGTDGMIHISHLAEGRVEKVTDVLSRRRRGAREVHRHRPERPHPTLAQGGARRPRGAAAGVERAVATRARVSRTGAACAGCRVRIARVAGAEDLPLPSYATAGSAGLDLAPPSTVTSSSNPVRA